MPNGKPGDHPLTDMLLHDLKLYGEETDELIRSISQLCTPKELHEWWNVEIGDSDIREEVVLRAARAQHETLLERARSGGWEPEE